MSKLWALLPVACAAFCQHFAECTFTQAPDEYLSREARARDLVLMRLRALKSAGRAVDAASIKRRNFIDDEIFGLLEKRNVPAAALTTDEEFLRRVTLDLTGRIPSAADVRAFLADTSLDKRDAAIDRLLGAPEFTDRWTMWLGDLLQNTATVANAAVNRTALGRNAFHAYIKEAVKTNKSLARIAIDVVSAKGNNFDIANGAANYPLGASTSMGPIQDTYDTMLARTATAFLGLSHYDCLLCHNGRGRLNQISAWGTGRTRTQAQEMAAFFSRMTFSAASPRNSFNVGDSADGGYDLNTDSGNRPNRTGGRVMPLYRETEAAPGGEDWRLAFAENMVKDPMFARNMANRIWKHMFNLALVDPVDSLDPARLDPANPPAGPWTLQASHPELLEKLAKEMAGADFDLRAFLRLLAQSSAYQLSAKAGGEWKDEYMGLYSRHYPRRLEGEEVHDAIAKATGVLGDYTVAGWDERVNWAVQLPEPVEPASNGPVRNFMNAFLRGDRDTLERSQSGSIQQQLFLMNDAFVVQRVRSEMSPRIREIAAIASDNELVEELYLTFLSRKPSDAERATAVASLAKGRTRAVEDLAWAAVNRVEFLFSY